MLQRANKIWTSSAGTYCMIEQRSLSRMALGICSFIPTANTCNPITDAAFIIRVRRFAAITQLQTVNSMKMLFTKCTSRLRNKWPSTWKQGSTLRTQKLFGALNPRYCQFSRWYGRPAHVLTGETPVPHDGYGRISIAASLSSPTIPR